MKNNTEFKSTKPTFHFQKLQSLRGSYWFFILFPLRLFCFPVKVFICDSGELRECGSRDDST